MTLAPLLESMAALEEEVRTEELRARLLQAKARMARLVSPDLPFAAAAATSPPLPTCQRSASRQPQPPLSPQPSHQPGPHFLTVPSQPHQAQQLDQVIKLAIETTLSAMRLEGRL
jgi:hypothetical protein